MSQCDSCFGQQELLLRLHIALFSNLIVKVCFVTIDFITCRLKKMIYIMWNFAVKQKKLKLVMYLCFTAYSWVT